MDWCHYLRRTGGDRRDAGACHGFCKSKTEAVSRRAMAISMGLSFVCSIAGTFLIPIPVAGSVIGDPGSCHRRLCGAWLGEAWKGTEPALCKEIGHAAMVGRLFGMAAKAVIGVAIFVVQLVSFWL